MAVNTPSAGSNLNAVPAPTKQTIPTAYVDFTSSATAGWAQQYLPELYEQEIERYGNRSVSGFLRMVGAEMPMSSDQVVWSEQGRLHLAYDTLTIGADASGSNVISGLPSGHAIRTGNVIVITDGTDEARAYVSADDTSATSITVKCYTSSTGLVNAGLVTTADAASLFVFGSEFAKGAGDSSFGVLQPEFKSFTNKPMILRDKYEVSGSDAAQIGWIEVSGEAGQSGYLWYLKAEGDTRVRFEDYAEIALVEAEKVTSTALTEVTGSEGLFAAIKDRGHSTQGIDGTGAATEDLSDFDEILKKLDSQGSIEENVLFLNRKTSLVIDDMLAGIGNAGYSNGTSFGIFENSEDMALNLGFSGFRRGSYDFYKTDWKYLNDIKLRGGLTQDASESTNVTRGVLVPAGTSSVYDQILGKNIRRPFLHVRYRASEADDRRMKSWITGSVGGNFTSGEDKMEVHYLTERCLVVQAANNFMLLN
tara:strand:+ start:1055 stop:2488 length:1434 start_codon:yes stop_codon:yes gene_type:complete